MSLSNESIEKLVDNISHDVFHLISNDPLYLEAVMNNLPGAITEVLGETSPELIGELGSRIMDRIGVDTGSNSPYDHDNIWKVRYETLFRYVKRTYADSYVDGAEYGVNVTMNGDFNTTMELD